MLVDHEVLLHARKQLAGGAQVIGLLRQGLDALEELLPLQLAVGLVIPDPLLAAHAELGHQAVGEAVNVEGLVQAMVRPGGSLLYLLLPVVFVKEVAELDEAQVRRHGGLAQLGGGRGDFQVGVAHCEDERKRKRSGITETTD